MASLGSRGAQVTWGYLKDWAAQNGVRDGDYVVTEDAALNDIDHFPAEDSGGRHGQLKLIFRGRRP